MIIDFNDSMFKTSYSFDSARSIVRPLSDAFSKQNCDVMGAIPYAVNNTQGSCLYCGERMYKLKNGTPNFTNTIHYDHIYPASKLNLFEVGNIALACEACNLAKSDRLPIDYYKMKAKSGEKLFIDEEDEFVLFLEKYTEPYRKKWPKHYSAGSREIESDEEFKDLVWELLFEPVEISRNSNRYNHETSTNKKLWKMVSEKAKEMYSESTVKDIVSRLGFTNNVFEGMYGCDSEVLESSFEEINDFFTEILISKSGSKNEMQKYKMIIKIIISIFEEQREAKNLIVPTNGEINSIAEKRANSFLTTNQQ